MIPDKIMSICKNLKIVLSSFKKFLKNKIVWVKLNHMNKSIYDRIEFLFNQKESKTNEHVAKWKDVPVVVCNWLPKTKKTKRLIPKPHQSNFSISSAGAAVNLSIVRDS